MRRRCCVGSLRGLGGTAVPAASTTTTDPRPAPRESRFGPATRTSLVSRPAPDSNFELGDWQGFYDLYELDLAARLAVERLELGALRARLEFCEPATLACGEHWSEDGIDRPNVCRDNRRVEVLLFHPDELPEPIGGDDPSGASLYGNKQYRWVVIGPKPDPHTIEGPCFEIAFAVDDPDTLPEEGRLRLYGGPYDLRIAFADATRDSGFTRFHFHGIAVGVDYSLEFEANAGAPVVLFSGLNLDAHINGIGDENAALTPSRVRGPSVCRGPRGRRPVHRRGRSRRARRTASSEGQTCARSGRQRRRRGALNGGTGFVHSR